MENSPSHNCLCGITAKPNKTRDGEVWFRCGKKIDFNTERKKKLAHRDLGCNLRMSQEMIEALNSVMVKGFDFKKDTPKCKYHHLFAKLYRVNDTEKENFGRWFYTCNAAAPDGTCNFFKWLDEGDEEISRHDEEDISETPRAPVKKRKIIHSTKAKTKFPVKKIKL